MQQAESGSQVVQTLLQLIHTSKFFIQLSVSPSNNSCLFNFPVDLLLVGGFNPIEKYKSNWKSSPNAGENLQKKIETT